MEVPETRYARSGDLSIAHQVFGSGPVDLVFVFGFISHVELAWENPWLRGMLERLGSIARVIWFDKRGIGLSDRSLGLGTPEDRMDDIRAVMDAAGSERAVVMGLSEGGPLAMLFAGTYPERVHSLVLWATFARILDAEDYPPGVPESVFGQFVAQLEAAWGTGDALPFFAPNLHEDPAMKRLSARYERNAATPRVAAEVMQANAQMDSRAALPALTMPTLLVHRTGDPLVAVAHGRWLAEHLPNARYVELPGDFHTNGAVGGDDDVLDAVEEFVTGTKPVRLDPVDRVLATVLFTDIVDSTVRAAEIGDHRWRELLDRHDRLSEQEIARHGGHLVKTTGDGLLATFDGPARGVRCAQAIEQQVAPLGIQVRAGLHTGEIERRGADVSGLGVHIGARISGLAAAGEVLVSRTVKDLVVGSGLAFEDRGQHQLKGVPDEWQVYAVVA